MSTFEQLCLEIKNRRKNRETWETIARSFDNERITRAHVWKMVNQGWEPDDYELRIILGLPAFKPMPVCPTHGVVHDYDCQAQEVFPIGQASIKRKPAAQVNAPPRLTAKVTDGLHRAVLEHARYEGVAMSEIVRRALEAYLLPEIFMGRSLETEAAAALPANGTHGKPAPERGKGV